MEKSVVLAKLEEFKDRPTEIGLADEGVVIHANIEGHWVFVKDDTLISIEINSSDGTYGFSTVDQRNNPFKITVIQFDTINYVRSYIANTPGDIATKVAGLTPVGTARTLDQIKAEIESSSVRRTSSPTGYTNNGINAAPDGDYGAFKGSYISTDKDGIPNNVKTKLL